ncbi:MAG: thiolase family protein [Actinomycetota bacterium]
MPRRVAIVGVGQTTHDEAQGLVYHELDYQAAKRALASVGADNGNIDTVITSGWDVVDGRTISDMHTCMAAGGYLKECSHVGEDGIMALVYAYLRLVSGLFDTAIITGHGHLESDFEAVSQVVYDPLIHRPVGASYTVSMGMQANAYMHKHGVTEEQAAEVVAKNRTNGANNPMAHLRAGVTVGDVLTGDMVCYPLRALDLPPRSVGGVALVLATEEAVRRLTDKPVWIRGLGWAIEGYELGDKDLARISSLDAAAKMAYRAAGIGEPSKELDVAEIHEATSFHELMAYEALGFCAEGEGAKLLAQGVTAPGGTLPVNASGGALSTNPYGATGLLRVAEAVLQLRGEAQGHQVDGAKLALAHGLSAPGGAAAPTNAVAILERSRGGGAL